MAIEISVSGKKSHGRPLQSPIYGYYHFSNVRMGAGVMSGSFISDGIPVENPYAVYQLIETDLTPSLNALTEKNELTGYVYINFYADKSSYDDGVNEIPISCIHEDKKIAVQNRILVTFVEQSDSLSGNIVDALCANFMGHIKAALADKYEFIAVDDLASNDYNAAVTTVASILSFYQNQECKKMEEELTIKDWETQQRNSITVPTTGLPSAVSGTPVAIQGMAYFMQLAAAVLQVKIPETAGNISVVNIS